MDTTLYHSFITIAETGSLTHAAEELHIAQPALSRQLRILQKQCGAKLLRTRQGQRRIELTPAGRALYEKARYLIQLEEQMLRDAAASEQGIRGTLRIATAPSVAFPLIHKRLADFSRLHLMETSIPEQVKALLSGAAEIGVANAPLIQPYRFSIHWTIADRMALFLHASHPLAAELAEGAEIEDNWLPLVSPENLRRVLDAMPLCLSAGCQDSVLTYLSSLPVSVTPLCVTTTKTAALQWARENCAAVIIPIDRSEPLASQLSAFLLPEENLSHFRAIYTVKNCPLSGLARSFLDFIDKTDAAARRLS